MARSIRLMLVALGILLSVMPTGVFAQATPAATPTSQDPSCRELRRYWQDLREAYPPVTVEIEDSVDAFTGRPLQQLSTVRSEHLIIVADYVDELAANVEAMDEVPEIIEELHRAYIGRLVLLSRIAVAQAEGRILDASLLIQQIEENGDVITEQVDILEAACGNQWTQFVERQPTAYFLMWNGWSD